MSVQFTNDDNPHDWNWETDPERWTTHRARYIESTTNFDSTAASIISWAELGYSYSGIGSQVDVSASTVKSRMDSIDDRDPTALMTRRPDEITIKSAVGVTGTSLGGGE